MWRNEKAIGLQALPYFVFMWLPQLIQTYLVWIDLDIDARNVQIQFCGFLIWLNLHAKFCLNQWQRRPNVFDMESSLCGAKSGPAFHTGRRSHSGHPTMGHWSDPTWAPLKVFSVQ